MEHDCGRFKLCTKVLVFLTALYFVIYSLRFSFIDEPEFTHNHLPRLRQQTQLQKNANNSQVFSPMEKSPLTHLGKIPIILFWTTFFGSKDYYFGLGVEPFKRRCNCTCELTTDRKRFSESSAIIVHPRDSFPPFPKERLPWQRFVFFLLESPVHSPSMKRFGSVFNWTMTYRRDSDICIPYGILTQRKYQNETIKNYAKGKTKLVIMINSNCGPPSKRQNYVKHLAQHIQVDVYGACGKKRCPENCPLSQNYKFYLSFENSICKDYVTEKLWINAFGRGLLPIVLGGSEYSDMLPPHSFIDIADYSSPKELADYLKVVDSNDTLYNSYFQWRQTLEAPLSRLDKMVRFCDLCHKIHNDGQSKVYTDLDGWWKSGTCVTPEKKYPTLVKYFQKNLV